MRVEGRDLFYKDKIVDIIEQLEKLHYDTDAEIHERLENKEDLSFLINLIYDIDECLAEIRKYKYN